MVRRDRPALRLTADVWTPPARWGPPSLDDPRVSRLIDDDWTPSPRDEGWAPPSREWLRDEFTTGYVWRVDGMLRVVSSALPVTVGARMRALGMPSGDRYATLVGTGARLGPRWAPYRMWGEGSVTSSTEPIAHDTMDLWRIEVWHSGAPSVRLVVIFNPPIARAESIVGMAGATDSQVRLAHAGRYVALQARLGRPGRLPGPGAYPDRTEFVEVASQAVRDLAHGHWKVTRDAVASELGIHERTLRRTMASHGLTWDEILGK